MNSALNLMDSVLKIMILRRPGERAAADGGSPLSRFSQTGEKWFPTRAWVHVVVPPTEVSRPRHDDLSSGVQKVMNFVLKQ